MACCGPQCGCWESKPSPLQGQVLSTAEPVLQHCLDLQSENHWASRKGWEEPGSRVCVCFQMCFHRMAETIKLLRSKSPGLRACARPITAGSAKIIPTPGTRAVPVKSPSQYTLTDQEWRHGVYNKTDCREASILSAGGRLCECP